jgi:hypothetical protein
MSIIKIIHQRGSHMKKTICIALLTIILQPSANAQFGNLMRDLKDLKGAIENIQQGTLPGVQPPAENSNVSKESTPKSSDSVVSSEEYCNRFSNSPSVQALAKAMAPLGKEAVKLSNRHTFLDNQNGDLEIWVASKLASLPGRNSRPPLTEAQLLNPLISIINSCAQKNTNSQIFLVGAELDRFESLGSNFLLGGSITVQSGPTKVARGNKNPREATLLAFLFEGAEEEIKKISPNPVTSFNVAADSLRQHQKALADRQAGEKQAEAQAAKRRAEAAAYEASPEGQLLYSYQHFQIVQHCHDMRKGLAVQFVNANEMSDYKSKMKQIEGKLKGALKDGNTDRLWQLADKNNRNWGGTVIDGKLIGTMDYFEVLTNNNKANWVSAKGDCDIQSEAFRGMIKSVLGSTPVKKSF